MPAINAAHGDQPARNAIAEATPHNAITEPTERSMPALIIITVMPIAPRATITVWVSTMRRFTMER